MSNPGRVVCSVGTGSYYPRCVDRLIESATAFAQMAYTWRGCFPETTHEEVPYKFKVDALRLAPVETSSRLWLDSPCRFIQDPEPLWEQLEQDGYLLLDSGYTVGPWSSDRCLDYFGARRDEVFNLPMPLGACWGYSTDSIMGRLFKGQLEQHAHKRTPFLGSLWNRNCSESKDPRVQGHRMDMVVTAFMARDLGLKITPMPHFWTCEKPPHSKAVVLSEGVDP